MNYLEYIQFEYHAREIREQWSSKIMLVNYINNEKNLKKNILKEINVREGLVSHVSFRESWQNKLIVPISVEVWSPNFGYFTNTSKVHNQTHGTHHSPYS